MTWTKFGVEFFDDCAIAGLSDAAVRTHAEALSWLYRSEVSSMRFLKMLVPRFAGSPDWQSGVRELIAQGFWESTGDSYKVKHHGDVFRQSLAAQQDKRTRDKRAQQRKRDREAGQLSDDDHAAARSDQDEVSVDVSADVSNDVDTDDAATQTDILSSSRTEEAWASAKQDVWNGPPVSPETGRSDCADCWKPLTTFAEKQRGACNSCYTKQLAARKSA